VIIDHDGGWQTQYCHLRRGSIRVQAGQTVERGAELGLVGLSGQTEFPHVHLTVRHEGEVVDPFTGRRQAAGCGGQERPLWRADAHAGYEEAALYNAGFWDETPDVEAIREGKRLEGTLTATSPALVLWVDIFGIRAGDRVRFRIDGPDGRLVLDKEEQIHRTQARRFIYAGRRRQGNVWPSGVYRGEVRLMRTTDREPMQWSVARTISLQ